MKKLLLAKVSLTVILEVINNGYFKVLNTSYNLKIAIQIMFINELNKVIKTSLKHLLNK